MQSNLHKEGCSGGGTPPVRPEGHILEKILNLEIYLLGRRVFIFYSSHTSIKICPNLIHSSGTPEDPKTLPRTLHWLLRTLHPEGHILEKLSFWSDGLATASGGPLNSGPSLSLCLSPPFPENRAIEFSNFLHVT